MSALYLQPDNVSFQRKQRLVNAYVLQCISNQDIMPSDIINLCMLFYDEILHWNINEIELHAFIAAKEQYKVYSNVFRQQGVEMRCAIVSQSKGSSTNQFWFQALMPSATISLLVIYFHVWCAQTLRNVKYTARFTKYNKRLKDDAWSTIHLPLFDVTPYNCLHIRIYTDVLQIEEETKDTKTQEARVAIFRNFRREIKMKRRVQFEWRMSDDLLDVFPDCPLSKGIFSHNFDEENRNWSLLCLPHGRAQAPHCVLVMLAINRLPHQIEAVKVEYTISNNISPTKVVTKKDAFSYAWWTHYCDSEQAMFDSNMIQSVNREHGLIFRVEIQLVAVYANASLSVSHSIPQHQWNSYGIVD